MFRNLYADTRNILLSRGFHIALRVIAIYQIFYFLLIKIVFIFALKQTMAAEEVAFIFANIAAFLVTAATLYISEREFSNGCIRNKIISGVRRTDAFLSAVIGGMLQGALYAMFACVISTVISVLFTGGYMTFSPPEIADYWLIITMACMTIGAFSTSLIMIFGGSKICYVIGLLIAFVIKVTNAFVLDALYPTKGFCKLTGTKLMAYRFIDRFIPYSYLASEPHYDMPSYLIGCGGLLIISVVIGLIVFNKKELS
ncbi:hypothetical protein [Butyrivibrio sp. VCD2006]|uniref:hypothetical protein n=1 Tax=Butyrivibrio sp. VCD2006 TaxID=1280664 RepID=UPI00041003BA|nr:hypothetical protein [Butyrivibrio sp. VCD2006]